MTPILLLLEPLAICSIFELSNYDNMYVRMQIFKRKEKKRKHPSNNSTIVNYTSPRGSSAIEISKLPKGSSAFIKSRSQHYNFFLNIVLYFTLCIIIALFYFYLFIFIYLLLFFFFVFTLSLLII